MTSEIEWERSDLPADPLTGIIEEQGTVERMHDGVLRIRAAAVLTDAVLGASIAVHRAPDLRVRIPDDLRRYVVEKGSITVDGISLTVVMPTDDGFTAAIIPHTLAVTSLGHKAEGAEVNIEVDVIAKYVERLLKCRS